MDVSEEISRKLVGLVARQMDLEEMATRSRQMLFGGTAALMVAVCLAVFAALLIEMVKERDLLGAFVLGASMTLVASFVFIALGMLLEST